MILPLTLNSDETNQEFIKRVVENKKELNATWNDVTETLNKLLSLDYSESYYRKGFSKFLIDEQQYKVSTNDRDALTQVRADLRNEARNNTLIQIAHDAVIQMEKNYKLPEIQLHASYNSETEGILMLSDWHYGIDVDSFFNTYNTDVAKRRLLKLQDRIINYISSYKLNKLHVVNLGDLICGRIHLQLRLNSRIDVVTQTMQVSELLSTFLCNISKYVNIEYYDTMDNHSRVEPKKENSLDLESMVRIITWYLRERLKDNKAINFNNNKYADDIASFNVLGHNIIAVHGDKDKPNQVINKLSLLTRSNYDLVLTAHFHHFNCDEQNDTVRVCNGSLMGTDQYAQDLRLTSSPSQTFIAVTRENVVEGIHKIIL